MVDVRIKPLEWVEINEGKVFRALLPVIGSIRIEPYGVCGWWEVLWSMPGQCDKLIPDVFDTPDEAKAAAQADYERRIRSTLSDAVAEREAEPVAWLYDWPNEYGSTETSASVQKIASVNRKPASNHRPLYLARPPQS